MIRYAFYTATELVSFLEKYKQYYEGCTLKYVSANLISFKNPLRHHITDEPVIFQIDDICVAVDCYFPSDMRICAGNLDEFAEVVPEYRIIDMLKNENNTELCGFMDFPEIENIKNRKIVSIDVEHSTEGFCINESNDTFRPDGGDYFNTVTITLDSGVRICIRGADASYDGYTTIWAE